MHSKKIDLTDQVSIIYSDFTTQAKGKNNYERKRLICLSFFKRELKKLKKRSPDKLPGLLNIKN